MQSRRKYLGRAASVASIGMVSGVAGCFGIGGGDNESSFKLTAIPSSPSAVIIEHIKEEGILSDKIEETSFDSVEAQLTWEGPPQFASGQSDMTVGDMSGLEASRMASERDLNLAVMGRITSNYVGPLIATGSEYDPENTGSVQATIDKVVEDDANVGIPGWESGSVPPSQIILEETYGHSLSEDGGDFNAISADYAAIPRLLQDGELAMGLSAPPLGAAPNFVESPPSVKPLYWNSSMLINEGFGAPPLGDLVTRQSFADDNEDAVLAVLDAYQEGVEWFVNDAMSIASDNQEIIGANNEDEAEFIVSWSFDSFDNSFAPEWPPFYQEPHATDEWIDMNLEFLENTANVGQIPDNWDEHLEYRSIN